MKVSDLIKNSGSTGFSFEILPPLKGSSIEKSFKAIDTLREFAPLYINITTHRSELVYKDTPDGLFRRVSERSRPCTVAVAAAIKNKYQIPTVPHLICSGFTALETEYALIDLNFLGICDLLILRGDKAKHENRFIAASGGYEHAIELEQQVNRFNEGIALDGSRIEGIDTPFSYGMACYPEKHEEAPNMDSDIYYLKEKVKNGASYLVTQMFFDNEKFYAFEDRCRKEGINVPIIPGIKPIVFRNQLTVLPRVFRSDIPEPFAAELRKCKTDDEAKEVGVEWCIQQCKDLIAHGVPSLHFYTMMASESVRRVAKEIY